MSAPWGISADQGAYWAWVHTARRPGELDTERSDTKATRATFPQVRRSRANPAEPWIRPHRAQARRPPPRRHHRPGGTTDDQSAMRSRTLAEAQASYPRTVIPGRPPNACKPCRTYRHHECLGSDRCTCAWCHGRAMIARGWETFDGSNNVQTLRAALGQSPGHRESEASSPRGGLVVQPGARPRPLRMRVRPGGHRQQDRTAPSVRVPASPQEGIPPQSPGTRGRTVLGPGHARARKPNPPPEGRKRAPARP